MDGSGAAVVKKPHRFRHAPAAIEGLTAREAWLVAVIAQGVAWYLAETFKPLSDRGHRTMQCGKGGVAVGRQVGEGATM